ncbi:MAG: CDP-alcohol phosphatidyltransferase family protein [Geminicoccales bacterium]
MLDAAMRRVIDPPLDRIGRRFAAAGISANAITLAGFAVGLLAVPALAAEWYGAALTLILLNRLADGLDGAVARRTKLTDFGGYLDIVCDFIFYAAVPFGFALGRPENSIAASFLVLSFVGTGTSFLAYAIMAAKRRLSCQRRGSKSLYYLGGLTEGTETIAIFVVCCLLPDAFVPLAYAFGALCWITTASRAATAWRTLRA